MESSLDTLTVRIAPWSHAKSRPKFPQAGRKNVGVKAFADAHHLMHSVMLSVEAE